MKKYMDELYARLEELSEKPLTLGRIEETDAVAGLLCRLHKIERLEVGKQGECDKLSREEAMHWAERMENADGTTGPHWTMNQTTAVADACGLSVDVPRWAWGVAMNMMYSDYCGVAAEFGVDRPEFYAALAKAFLMDKDGPGPEEKLCAYYRHIASRSR